MKKEESLVVSKRERPVLEELLTKLRREAASKEQSPDSAASPESGTKRTFGEFTYKFSK